MWEDRREEDNDGEAGMGKREARTRERSSSRILELEKERNSADPNTRTAHSFSSGPRSLKTRGSLLLSRVSEQNPD